MIRRPPRSPLFPSTPLFRSHRREPDAERQHPGDPVQNEEEEPEWRGREERGQQDTPWASGGRERGSGQRRRERPGSPRRRRGENPRQEQQGRRERQQRGPVEPSHARPLVPMALSASGKRAAGRRGRAGSTVATRAKLPALSPKSETKLPKKQAPSGEKPSALPSAVASAIPPVVLHPKM